MSLNEFYIFAPAPKKLIFATSLTAYANYMYVFKATAGALFNNIKKFSVALVNEVPI